MNNPWKLATIGLALVMVTALVTGLTTAYWARPSAAPDAPSYPGVGWHGFTPQARAAAAPANPRPAASATAPRPLYRPAAVTGAPASTAPPAPIATPVAATASDCSTGGDRALRIAKPGVLGTLLGAGLGAAGGAIADGGKGAGKGALIGGITGAALGAGYGAYKTRQDCGTIFGRADDPAALAAAAPATAAAQTPWRSSDRISIVDAN